MEPLFVPLSDDERKDLDRRWPRSKGRAIEELAIEIVQIYFRRQNPRCSFERPKRGADLVISFPGDQAPISIEVKGTGANGIAPTQIKVSSDASHRLLTEAMPLFRVSDVFGRNPAIRILIYGKHFELYEEPRWAFRLLQPAKGTSLQRRVVDRDTKAALVKKRDSRPKYQALGQWLAGQAGSEVVLRLPDAQQKLGFPLPASAHRYHAFWANQSDTRNRPWAKAWSEAGFRVDALKLSPPDPWVRFKRVKQTTST